MRLTYFPSQGVRHPRIASLLRSVHMPVKHVVPAPRRSNGRYLNGDGFSQSYGMGALGSDQTMLSVLAVDTRLAWRALKANKIVEALGRGEAILEQFTSPLSKRVVEEAQVSAGLIDAAARLADDYNAGVQGVSEATVIAAIDIVGVRAAYLEGLDKAWGTASQEQDAIASAQAEDRRVGATVHRQEASEAEGQAARKWAEDRQCSVLSVATGEVTMQQYLSSCTSAAKWAKLAIGGVVLYFLAKTFKGGR